ncbi:hypothetical protein ACOME3_010827, partial [Neoechinorhynchus agilis]
DGPSTKHCRHCTAPAQTQLHVLNLCPKNITKMVERHDAVQGSFTWAQQKRWGSRWEIHTENRIYDNQGRLNKPDLILVDRQQKKAQIIDIAVYYETTKERSENTILEKEDKYKHITEQIASLYNLELHDVKTIGLAVGTRGAYTPELLKGLRLFNLSEKTAENMSKTAADKSIQVYNNFMGHTWSLR